MGTKSGPVQFLTEYLPCVSIELLKRLDDSSEEVRAEALGALGRWLSCLGREYDPQAFQPHLELLFQQLLLHLDDPDGAVQDAVLGEALRGGVMW